VNERLSLADAYVMAWLDGLNRRPARPLPPVTLPPAPIGPQRSTGGDGE
jgi:hypothetical protein